MAHDEGHFERGIRREMGRALAGLAGPVRVTLFTDGPACEFCPDVEALLREVAAISDRIVLEIRDRRLDPAAARAAGVDKVPALILDGPAGARVRFYGLPGGLEFTTLVAALRETAAGRAEVAPEARAIMAGVSAPVRIQVFVLPTCPWCPPAARAAHRFATSFPGVTAEVVEMTEFPDLAATYAVQSVPHVVLNESVTWDGDGGDVALAAAVARAARAPVRA